MRTSILGKATLPVLMLVAGVGYSGVALAGDVTSAVCSDVSVSPHGGFNQQAICPSGQTATGGGYQLTASNGSLLKLSVTETMPFFSNITPTGWQVVGTNSTGTAGTLRVCVLCIGN